MVVGFEEGLKGVAVWELGVIAAVDMRSLIELRSLEVGSQ